MSKPIKILTSLRQSIPIKALTPGLVGIAMLTLERAIQNRFLQTPKQDFDNDPESRSNWLSILVYETANSLGRTIFAAYDNYFAFILMMLLVNVILHGSDIIKYFSTQEKNIASAARWKSIGFLLHLLRTLLVYSLIFFSYQALWICLGSGISLQVLHQVATGESMKSIETLSIETILSNRILEEDSSLYLPLQEFPKPSLSIGKVLSQIDTRAVSIKLSKNGKTAFIGTTSPPTLKIIDVSDAESPIILSTFILRKLSSNTIYRTLFLSPDETKLYTSTIDYLEVIDITNLTP